MLKKREKNIEICTSLISNSKAPFVFSKGMMNSKWTAVSSGNKHAGRQDMTCPDVTQPSGPSLSFVCEKRVSHICDWLMCICSHALHKYCLFACVWESHSGWQSCLRTVSTLGRPLAFFPAARSPKTLKATVKVVYSAAFAQFQAGSRDSGGKENPGLGCGRLLKSKIPTK